MLARPSRSHAPMGSSRRRSSSCGPRRGPSTPASVPDRHPGCRHLGAEGVPQIVEAHVAHLGSAECQLVRAVPAPSGRGRRRSPGGGKPGRRGPGTPSAGSGGLARRQPGRSSAPSATRAGTSVCPSGPDVGLADANPASFPVHVPPAQGQQLALAQANHRGRQVHRPVGVLPSGLSSEWTPPGDAPGLNHGLLLRGGGPGDEEDPSSRPLRPRWPRRPGAAFPPGSVLQDWRGVLPGAEGADQARSLTISRRSPAGSREFPVAADHGQRHRSRRAAE